MSNRPRTALKRADADPRMPDDLISHKSFASKLSKGSLASRDRMDFDQRSVAPSVVSKAPTESSIDEADEWTAILKFNALLHYEEQK